MSESWECKFDHNPKPLHHKYMGDGWYRKTVSIPTEWAGKLIWLKVVAIGAAQGVPNVSLGWWFMGEQVGTALLDHPVFGDLPHEGFLSPLLFRIVGKGRSLKHAARDERDLFMVGEGGGDCFVYLARRKVGAGCLLESFGLDLLSGKPEGTAILDGMISAALDGLVE